MSFNVIVLGSSGGYAGAGKACSGYLLQHEENTLMLDLGAGALSNLLKYLDADALGGLAISHLHYDHYMDIYGLLTARRFWPATLPPLPVLLPSGAGESIASVISPENREVFMECLDRRELASGGEFDFAGFKVSARPAQHIDDSFIFRITIADRTLCYSGDTECCDALLELAGAADLFLCEATFNSQVPVKIPGHLSGKEAGEIASEARVGRLVLTHIWPTLDADIAVEDARASYDGPIDVATEGLTLYVGPYPCAI
jgi:ribonuclease BN (tRNA processing enzyme)